MIWDSFLRFLTDLGWFVGLWIGLAAAVRLGRRLGRRLAGSRLVWRIRRRRAWRRPRDGSFTPAPAPPSAPAPAAPEWSGALIVRADGDRLVPSIQLRGPPFPVPARVRLDLMDGNGTWRRMSEREVTAPDLGTEVPLPAFRVPDGLDVEDVVGWVWKALLVVGHRTHVLCWEVLRPITGLNREAEFAARDDAV